MKKYCDNPYLKLLRSLEPPDQIAIRNEYTRIAYDKLDGNEKRYIKAAVRNLSKLRNIGEGGAIQILAAVSQIMDAAGWPRKKDENGN